MLSPTTQNLAENYRMHSGERFMKRGIRHAMDKAVPSIFDGVIGTDNYNNEMVLIFTNKAKTIMNQGFQ